MNRASKSGLLIAIISIITGLILLFYPGSSLIILCRILGVSLAASGLIGLIQAIQLMQAIHINIPFAGSLIVLIVGLIILFDPTLVISIIPIIVGLCIMLSGLINLFNLINHRALYQGGFGISLFLAILTVALGFLILWNPFESASFLVMMIGIILLYNGIVSIYFHFKL
ncbi:MAG: DUF308 domain-containing protein [Lachnospiraceae bacterium]|nr:DUF308 domain-containing protein [Lachnospiraceae bacterium]